MLIAATCDAPSAGERLPLSWAARLKPFWMAPPFLGSTWVHYGLSVVLWTVAAFAVLLVLTSPRALVLDERGFRQVALVPFFPLLVRRGLVAWSSVDYFEVARPWLGLTLPGAPGLVRYSQHGRLQRFRGVTAVYALRSGARALDGEQLCDLLSGRLLQWRAASDVGN